MKNILKQRNRVAFIRTRVAIIGNKVTRTRNKVAIMKNKIAIMGNKVTIVINSHNYQKQRCKYYKCSAIHDNKAIMRKSCDYDKQCQYNANIRNKVTIIGNKVMKNKFAIMRKNGTIIKQN